MAEFSIHDLILQALFPNEEVLFVSVPRLPTVQCIICGRRGPGTSGTWAEVNAAEGPRRRRGWRSWQNLCLNDHTPECACGQFFPSLQSVAEHVSQHRRYHHEGHGRMDKVGW